MSRSVLTRFWKDMSPVGKQTFRWDLLRGGFDGAGQAFYGTFALLIAISFFDCPVYLKVLIAAGPQCGLGISFLYATYSHCFIGRRNIEAAIPLFFSSLCLVVCAASEDSTVFAVFAFLASFCFMCRYPLMTAIYRENYKRIVRGQAFSFSVLLTAVSTALILRYGGLYLDGGIERFRPLFLILATLILGSAVALLKIPSVPSPRTKPPNPFSYFSILGKDPAFVYVLVTWFLFGFANLSLMPQRLEFVTQTEYGFELSPGMVSLVVGVIPEMFRIILVLPMGWLFDRLNFIVLRILINLLFILYMIIYFSASTVWVLMAGAALLGVAFAGGTIAWNLWVTKFAIPSETAKYMAMHTFFNGIRGILAPAAGYWIASLVTIPQAAWFGVTLISIATFMLVPLVSKGAPNDWRSADVPLSEN